MKKITRIGIGGPVGSGKTAVIEVITPILIQRGYKPLIITNDIVTTEDAKQVKRTLKGILDEDKILGVETGACPHTAVREDPSMNIAAVEEMEEKFPDSDLIMIESGGDNLTLTFSPALADFYIYVIDVAEGEKIPRKNGPGHSDHQQNRPGALRGREPGGHGKRHPSGAQRPPLHPHQLQNRAWHRSAGGYDRTHVPVRPQTLCPGDQG